MNEDKNCPIRRYLFVFSVVVFLWTLISLLLLSCFFWRTWYFVSFRILWFYFSFIIMTYSLCGCGCRCCRRGRCFGFCCRRCDIRCVYYLLFGMLNQSMFVCLCAWARWRLNYNKFETRLIGCHANETFFHFSIYCFDWSKKIQFFCCFFEMQISDLFWLTHKQTMQLLNT